MPQELPGLVKLDKQLAIPVITVLGRAFWKYPLLTYFFPEERDRKSIMDNLMAFPVYTCLRYGEVYATSAKLEGAAVWSPSEAYPVSFWRTLRSLPLKNIWGMTRSASFRMHAVDRFLIEIRQRQAPRHHYYLEILGVDPAYQKQGCSSKLVRPMLHRLDQEKLPCYLETQDPQDVPIYQHFGFEIVEHTSIPETPLYSWALLRQPAQISSHQ